jgi:hypothetical protein
LTYFVWRQNPQCEGFNRGRALFDAKAQSHGRVLYKVEKEGDNYVIGAGAVRGINVGDQFTLYDQPEPSQTSSPLDIFLVREAHPFHSTIVPLGASQLTLPTPVFALQTKAGDIHDLPVYVVEHGELVPVFQTLVQKMYDVRPDCPRMVLVEKDKAAVIIDLDDDKKVVFDIQLPDKRVLDERVLTELIVAASGNWQHISFSVELDISKLHPILDAATHFHWHLCRTAQDHILQNKVRFLFTQVKHEGNYDEDLHPVIEPIGDNLNRNGMISLITGAESKGMYGIKIINDTARPLYMALFYFDMNDFSISTCLLTR